MVSSQSFGKQESHTDVNLQQEKKRAIFLILQVKRRNSFLKQFLHYEVSASKKKQIATMPKYPYKRLTSDN